MSTINNAVLRMLPVMFTTLATAQSITITDTSSTSGKATYNWSATTQSGASIPNKAFGAFSNYGFRTMTGIELQQSNSLFYRMGHEVTLLSFKTTRKENNYTIINKGSRSFVGVTWM